jgi:hypothetical protein
MAPQAALNRVFGSNKKGDPAVTHLQTPSPQLLGRRTLLQAAAAGAAGLALPARAQSAWPAKPVTLVVPFPAGGGTDAFARPMSAQFARLTEKQLIIDNKGGAGGTLGAGVAAKAAPDRFTVTELCRTVPPFSGDDDRRRRRRGRAERMNPESG